MTEIIPVVDIELEDLCEVGEAEQRGEIAHDASESFPAHARTQEAESSRIQSNTPEGDAGNNVADAKGKPSCTGSASLGNWVGAALGIGTLIVAIYYGYWSLSLQRWSALKDFRSQCQEAKVETLSLKNNLTQLRG
jgi:hypothetical protein